MIGALAASGAFYVFAAILLASSLMVITSRNPVYSVLFLVLAFFNAAGLFLLAGAEFLALLLVIVYVGAVAVLFLFVVMMLDVDFESLRSGFQKYAPVGALVGIVLLAELGFAFLRWQVASGAATDAPVPAGMTNAAALGAILYTKYIFLFQSAGIILLVAMIGAIVLTHRERHRTRRQVIAKQIARVPSDTLVITTPAIGAGVGATGVFRPLVVAVPRKGHGGHGHDDHGHDDHGHDDHGHDTHADYDHEDYSHLDHTHGGQTQDDKGDGHPHHDHVGGAH